MHDCVYQLLFQLQMGKKKLKSSQHKQLQYPLVRVSHVYCYVMSLSLITAGVMVFLITCALIGIVALIVKHKMVATKNSRGKTLLLAQILYLLIHYSFNCYRKSY